MSHRLVIFFIPRNAYATHNHSAVYAVGISACLSVCHARVLRQKEFVIMSASLDGSPLRRKHNTLADVLIGGGGGGVKCR